MMTNDKSAHILNASSNLLGLCFVVLTSLKIFRLTEKTYIDETVAIALSFFMLSCILSFLSIKGDIKGGTKLENVADYLFLGGLLILFITAMLIIFNIIG